MARRTRKRRQHRPRGLRGVFIPVVVGAVSVFIATHYAVDWGREPAAGAVTAPLVADPLVRDEETFVLEAPPTAAPTPSPASRNTPTREPPTSPPVMTVPPRIPLTTAPSSEGLARAPFTLDFPLVAEVSARIVGHSGRYGIAIKNLRTGQGVLIDSDREFEAASLFKLPIMYEVFKQREARALSFDEQLVLTERHVAYDLGTLDRPAGSTMGVAEALDRMITFSDNSAAVLLTDRVGAFTVNQDLVALGMPHTRVLLDNLTTSPGDMLRLLEMAALGEAVSPRASGEMVQLMARQRVNDRLPRLLPPGTVVAHKTGNLPGVVNDVGIIYGPSGPFVVAVLVDGTNDEAEATRATADIALMAYRRFS